MPGVALGVGSFQPHEEELLREAAQSAGLTFEHLLHWQDGLAKLDEALPTCLVVDHSQAEPVCLAVRQQVRLAALPIISMVSHVTELSLAEIFSWGGEDVVRWEREQSLAARFRRLPAPAPKAVGPVEGRRVLVVAPDRLRRVVLARVLMGAGYALQFAAEIGEVTELVRNAPPRLVVVESNDEAHWVALSEMARGVPGTIFIVSTTPRLVKACFSKVGQLSNLSVTDTFAPPENVVFLANELGRATGTDNRASRRLLYGTCVAYRIAGREIDEHGLTYNVSGAGLYVRTLAPPSDDQVWLELTPPRTDRRVRLEGRVRWRRGYGPSVQATVPPGFGVEITDGARIEIDTWQRGYDALYETLGR